MLTLVIALAAVPPAAGDSWVRVRSGGFTAVGNASYEDIRDVLLELEGFRHLIGRAFALPAVVEPATVVVFRDERAFAPFRPADAGGAARGTVQGYYLTTGGADYIAIAMHRDVRRTFQHIFHEYTHAVLRRALGSLPPWMNEGLAEFYSTVRADPRTRRSVIGAPPASRLATLRSGRLLPLREVLSFDGSTLSRTPEWSAAFYAQSWALVHHVVLGAGRGPAGLAADVRARRTGVPLEDAVRDAFGTSVEDLDAALARQVRGGSFRETVVEDAGPPLARTTREAMRPGEVEALLGTLRAALDALPRGR